MKKYSVFICVIFVVFAKLLFLLTHHIQEDALISWRVAQNIIDYGVYGFNGEEKISSSTTHLYVLITIIFKLIFSDYFIYPLLIFNNILFTYGTKILADLLLNSNKSKILFILFINFLPPAIKMSVLGMEFGILFFLYILFLKYAIFQNKNWAYFLFPILIVWTRLDAGLFLLIVYLYDVIKNKKLNLYFTLSGIVCVLSIISFNYFYFGEFVNHTIIAKKIAYDKNHSIGQKFYFMLLNTNFYSMLKIPLEITKINLFFIITLVFSIISLIKIKPLLSKSQFYILILMYTYSCVRILIFGFANSWFDWYYWTPQLFMFAPILLWFVLKPTEIKIFYYVIIFFIPLLSYQIIHSTATGNGEWNYRRQIGLYIDKIEPDKNKTIFLEPAGYVPYFSGLKGIDYVGLIDKRITEEFIKDRENVFENVLKDIKPDYILDFHKPLFNNRIDSTEINKYELIKEFHISDIAQSDNLILDKIYKLKPSGKDYYLYKRKTK